MKISKIIVLVVSLLIITACNSKEEENNDVSFYVGTYTDTESQGIYKYSIDKNGHLKQIGLVAKTKNPSFLAKSADNKFLLAVNETNVNGTGTVESFLIKGDRLEFISRSSSGGAHPCFISINQSGYILTANYTGGNVGLLKLNKKGELSNLLDVQQHTGEGTTERQQEPHAHSAWFKDEMNIISVDLGTNELWFSELDTINQKFIPLKQKKLGMQPGAGPRHLEFHPNGKWIYVLNELNNTISLVRKSSHKYEKDPHSISSLPKNYTETNTSADIHITSDGKFLYTSNRGHNSIAIFEVNAWTGELSLIGHQNTKGEGPRNFSISPDGKFLLVANQHTNSIVSFKRDETTGLLSLASQVDAPTPACILF